MPTGLLFKALAVILAATALLGSIWGLHRAVDGAGYQRGKAEVESVWQAREARQNASYAAKIRELSEAAAAATQRGASDTAKTVRKLTLEKADEVAKRDAVIADLRAGRRVFVDPGSPGCNPPGGSPPRTTTADSPGDQPAEGGQLSQKLGEFLVAEASRADQVVHDFNAALELLRSDRRVCGAADAER